MSDQIIVTGGYGGPIGRFKTTEVLRNGTAVTCNIPPLQYGTVAQASVAIPNGLVICGGYTDYRSCLRLTSENEWVPFPELKSSWYYFNMFYMNEKLWAIGRGSRVEYIDPSIGSRWTSVSPSPYRYQSGSCAAELSNNRIISTGGNYRHVSS